MIATGTAVRVGSGQLRFPGEPGRIEARIAGAEGTRQVYEVAGHIRLEVLAPIAGPDDAPLRAPLDHIAIELDRNDDFSLLPELPSTEKSVWRPFRTN